MKCADCEAMTAAYLEGLCGDADARGVEEHLASCPSCRLRAEAFGRLRSRLALDAQKVAVADLRSAVMTRIDASVTTKPRRGRSISMIRIVRRYGPYGFAAAAALVTAIVLFASRPQAAAYTLEETIAANKGVKTFHATAEYFKSPSTQESWAQFDADGRLVRLRRDMPKTEDGHKVVLFDGEKVHVWFVDKNGVATVTDKTQIAQTAASLFDPRAAIQDLNDKIGSGEAKVLEKRLSEDGRDFVWKVAVKGRPGLFDLYYVDQSTKLVHKVETYEDGAGSVLVCRFTFLDYNADAPESLWRFEARADALRVDETTQSIGLEKGSMTDGEVAEAVTRKFFEAMIAKDYDAAGRLMSGVPGPWLRERMGSMNYVRIVSIGKATPYPDPRVGGMAVPYEVEIEANGGKSIKSFRAAVRPVYSQPDRWAIHGGI